MDAKSQQNFYNKDVIVVISKKLSLWSIHFQDLVQRVTKWPIIIHYFRFMLCIAFTLWKNNNRLKPSSKIFYWPFQGGTSFVDLLRFCSVLCLLCLCARLFICALRSPAGKGLTSWLSFVVSAVSLSLSHWYPGSGVVLDCIDSWSLHPYLPWHIFIIKFIGHMRSRHEIQSHSCSRV